MFCIVIETRWFEHNGKMRRDFVVRVTNRATRSTPIEVNSNLTQEDAELLVQQYGVRLLEMANDYKGYTKELSALDPRWKK